ncbi:MAG: hypothetical protein JSR91_00410 [Proteobacteria bacterium]|nr:hypothetical protein [Pseudomonadota bacterium]
MNEREVTELAEEILKSVDIAPEHAWNAACIAFKRLRGTGERGGDVERIAKAIYEEEPFFLPAGQMIDGVDLARKLTFDDAPAYRQEHARRLARAALSAECAPDREADVMRALKLGRQYIWAAYDDGDAEFADEIKADLDFVDTLLTRPTPGAKESADE